MFARTRARVTLRFDLPTLAPDLSDAVLALEAIDGVEPTAERALRAEAHAGSWVEQRGTWMRRKPPEEARTSRGLEVPAAP
jgi:hypothetical protein